MRKLVFLCVFLFSFNAKSEDNRRFNFRFNPMLIAIGGNLDLDYYITPQFTLGPSFFGWGGCGPRQTGTDAPDGRQCSTWTSYGLRANQYFNLSEWKHNLYVGPGLYQTKKQVSYRLNHENLTGDVSAMTLTALVGYLYQTEGRFNVSLGVGALTFLNKPADVTVSNANLHTDISSGATTAFFAEFSLGMRF